MVAGADAGSLVAEEAADHRGAEVVEGAVVDGVDVARGDLADVVDEVADGGPGAVHRQRQGVDGRAGGGQGVAGMEEGVVDEEADVGDARDVGVDDRVPGAVDLAVEAGRLERLPLPHGRDARTEAVQSLGDGGVGPDAQVRVAVGGAAQVLLREVVGVLVGDQDRVGAVQGVRVGQAARIDDQATAVLLYADTGMAELGELHVERPLVRKIGELVRAVRIVDAMPPGEADVLGFLDRRGPLTTADLAHRRGVTHQSAAKSVKDLIAAGLVRTEPHPSDGRKLLVHITDPGRTRLRHERERRTHTLGAAIRDTFSADERQRLRECAGLLSRLTARLIGTESDPRA